MAVKSRGNGDLGIGKLDLEFGFRSKGSRGMLREMNESG